MLLLVFFKAVAWSSLGWDCLPKLPLHRVHRSSWKIEERVSMALEWSISYIMKLV